MSNVQFAAQSKFLPVAKAILEWLTIKQDFCCHHNLQLSIVICLFFILILGKFESSNGVFGWMLGWHCTVMLACSHWTLKMCINTQLRGNCNFGKPVRIPLWFCECACDLDFQLWVQVTGSTTIYKLHLCHWHATQIPSSDRVRGAASSACFARRFSLGSGNSHELFVVDHGNGLSEHGMVHTNMVHLAAFLAARSSLSRVLL